MIAVLTFMLVIGQQIEFDKIKCSDTPQKGQLKKNSILKSQQYCVWALYYLHFYCKPPETLQL